MIAERFTRAKEDLRDRMIGHAATQYRLIVRDTHAVLAQAARIASSPVARMVGLLGCSALPPGQGLIITKCRSIHTWFMRFPIDAIFVDAAWSVVRFWKILPPWRMTSVVWRAQAVIELPAGSVQQARLGIGDRLIIEPLTGNRP